MAREGQGKLNLHSSPAIPQNPRACNPRRATSRPLPQPMAYHSHTRRDSIPQIFFVVLEAMPIQKQEKLLLKRSRSMMFGLIFEILSDVPEFRMTDRERSVS